MTQEMQTPDGADALFAPEGAAAADMPAETFSVQVDGQELYLTLPQLVQAAQDGLTKVNKAARTAQAAAQVPEGEVYARFMEEYPDVAPADIPAAVWEQAEREGSLVSAYRSYELARLREELDAMRKNSENAAGQIGSARSDGEAPEHDPVIRALLGR